MNNPIKKIALILVLVILLPAAFFTFYQINSLSESERVIERTYSNQLDAILFSVNQYSDDVISSWRRERMNLVLAKGASHPEQFETKLDSFLNVNDSKPSSSIINIPFSMIFSPNSVDCGSLM